jgi:hypothetical protein
MPGKQCPTRWQIAAMLFLVMRSAVAGEVIRFGFEPDDPQLAKRIAAAPNVSKVEGGQISSDSS